MSYASKESGGVPMRKAMASPCQYVKSLGRYGGVAWSFITRVLSSILWLTLLLLVLCFVVSIIDKWNKNLRLKASLMSDANHDDVGSALSREYESLMELSAGVRGLRVDYDVAKSLVAERVDELETASEIVKAAASKVDEVKEELSVVVKNHENALKVWKEKNDALIRAKTNEEFFEAIAMAALNVVRHKERKPMP